MYSDVQRLVIDTQPTIIQYFRLRWHPCIMQSTSFKRLWKAINKIKSVISPAHATRTVDSDIGKVKRNVICTVSKNNKWSEHKRHFDNELL